MYNDDANKIVKQAMQEKNAIKNINFLINLAMVTNDTKPAPEEPQTFNEAWSHPNIDSGKNARSDLQRICRYEQATGMAHDT